MRPLKFGNFKVIVHPNYLFPGEFLAVYACNFHYKSIQVVKQEIKYPYNWFMMTITYVSILAERYIVSLPFCVLEIWGQKK